MFTVSGPLFVGSLPSLISVENPITAIDFSLPPPVSAPDTGWF